MNLSYSKTRSTPENNAPVEAAGQMFDKLNEATIRNRANYNDQLRDLQIDVGPNAENQAYVNNYKDALNKDVNEMAERGDYAYMGKMLQEHASSILKDKNITNMANNWAKTQGKLDMIRQNTKIDAGTRSVFIKDYRDNFKNDIDEDTQVINEYQVDQPSETVDVQGLLLQSLNTLKSNSWKQGDVFVIDDAGKLVTLPAGTQMEEDENGYKTADGYFNKVTGLDKAGLPFLANELRGNESIDQGRTTAMVQSMLESNNKAMSYLVQNYAVNNLDGLKELSGGQKIGEIIQGIMDGSLDQDGAIKNSIIAASGEKLAAAYASKNSMKVTSLDFQPGMVDKTGYGKSNNSAANPVTYSMRPGTNNTGKLTSEDIYNAGVTSDNNLKTSIDDFTGDINPVTHSATFNGKDVSPETVKVTKDALYNAISTGDIETIRELKNVVGYSDKQVKKFEQQSKDIQYTKQIAKDRNLQIKDILYRQIATPSDKALVDFTNGVELEDGTWDIFSDLQSLGLSKDEFTSIGGITDIRNLELLSKAFASIPEQQFQESINTILDKNIDEHHGPMRMANKLFSTVFNALNSVMQGVEGTTPESLRGAADFATTLLESDNPNKANIISKIKDLTDDADGSFFKLKSSRIKELENQAEDQLKTLGTGSKEVKVASNNIGMLVANDKEAERIEASIASGLNQMYDGNNLTTFQLYYPGGKPVKLNGKDAELSEEVIRALSNKGNIKLGNITSMITPIGDAPTFEISVKVGKESGEDAQYQIFNIPISEELGVTTDKLERFKSGVDYEVARAENMLTKFSMNSVSIPDTAFKIRRTKGGNIMYNDGVNTYSQEEGSAMLKNALRTRNMLSNAENLPTINTSNISFDSNGVASSSSAKEIRDLARIFDIDIRLATGTPSDIASFKAQIEQAQRSYESLKGNK